MNRTGFRLSLLLAGIVAVAVAVVALYRLGGNDPAAWATVSAVLAVLAALSAAWTSQRVVELQEDALAPNPVPCIDMRSRYQLAQFNISNRGASSAYNVQLKWDQPLESANREPVMLGVDGPIPVIGPGEAASVKLGAPFAYLKVWTDTTRRGTIAFDDATGKHYSRSFIVSPEHERVALSYNEERVRTEYELQQIPDALGKIAKALEKLNTTSRQSS
jgi:hypothetical protein